MPQSLRNTWIAILVATLAVVVSGAFIVKRFVHHVLVDCKGTLHAEHPLTDDLGFTREEPADLEIKYDLQDGRYKNVRVVWNRGDACACSDIPIRWKQEIPPTSLRFYRDASTGWYMVRDSAGGPDLAVFRKVNDRGRRMEWNKVVEPHNVSMLVLLFALGALGVAAGHAFLARPYATRMNEWTPGTLRPDGLVEGETGASLGRVDPRARIPAGPVIVDPKAIEGRDVYREMPILTRRNVGAGTHQRWYEGTLRRLRDARSLAILSTIATVFALIARIIGA